MILNSTHRNMLISPARSIAGKVELYEGSTLLNTFKHTDALSSFTISRAGDKKFFGFGVCQEAEVKLVDRERAINIEKEQIFKVSFVVNNSTVSPTPRFYVSEVMRDENTNELTIKAYDIIHKAKSHTVAELNLEAPYTIGDVVSKIVGFLGVSFSYDTLTRAAFNTEYPEGANFNGTETLREVLDDIAEATQTIYFVNNSNALTFKHLKKDADPVLTIRKADYFELKSKTNRTLSDICSATELGDNVITTSGIGGETQYVRDNPFWELRNDIATLLDNAIALAGGITINQFTCKWRGNYLVEPGDKIALITKDDSTVYSYLLDEKYTYNGGFSAETTWSYGEKNGESVDNPTSLGDALKQTFAKVDKVNKEIEIVASDITELSEEIGSIKVTTEEIEAKVESLNYDEEFGTINNKISQLEMTDSSITQSVNSLEENINEVTGEIDLLNQKVSTVVTPENVEIIVREQLSSGLDSVTTSTGFTFDKNGLTVNKAGTEMTTQITEDGMVIYRDNTPVLTTNHNGVQATNLQATTFLTIGGLNRFEEYIDIDGNVRIGAFWLLD